jgi:hypothetical protein
MIAGLSVASRHVRRRLHPAITRPARYPEADRYRKHVPATAHLWLLILHGLLGAPSLRRGYARMADLGGVFARLGLRERG